MSLDTHVIIDRLHEAAGMGVRSVMFAGEGEPLPHKRMQEIAASAVASEIDVAYTTNGVLLNKVDLSIATWCKVSVNAGTAESYAKVHRTQPRDFSTVWRNIELANARRGHCTLGVQCLMLPELSHEAEELARRCRDAGVDYLVIAASRRASSHFWGYYPPLSFVAEGDGRIVGFIIGSMGGPEYALPVSGWVTAMGVDPDYQGRGVGKALLKAFIDVCEISRIPSRMMLPRNELFENMLLALGFEKEAWWTTLESPSVFPDWVNGRK